MQINTYLSFDGTCDEAFALYKSVLGGEITMRFTVGESPMAAEFDPSLHNRIMHMRFVAHGQVLMGADAMGECATNGKPQGFCVSVNIDSPEEAARIFNGLAAGGEITMPLAETFWAKSFGMLTDKFGIPWMINCEKPM